MKNFIFIFLLTFLGCTKFGKNVTIKGRVLNPITGEGIEGAELNLLRGTLELPGGLKSVKKVTTDADGYYEISKLSLSDLYLSVGNFGDRFAIGWFQDGELIIKDNNNFPVTKHKTMHADFHAVEYGNLQINIKNLACFDPNDELKIFRTHSITDLYNSVPNPAIYIGCTDLVGSSYKSPMGWYTYSGTVTKNGVVTTISDSIYLNGGETKVWNIYY